MLSMCYSIRVNNEVESLALKIKPHSTVNSSHVEDEIFKLQFVIQLKFRDQGQF